MVISVTYRIPMYHQTGPASCLLSEAVVIDGVWHIGAQEACCAGPSGAHAADAIDAKGSAGQVLAHSSVQAINSKENRDK